MKFIIVVNAKQRSASGSVICQVSEFLLELDDVIVLMCVD